MDLQGQYDIAVVERDRGREIARRVQAAPADHIWMQDAPPWDLPKDGWPQHAAGRKPPLAQ